MIPLPVGTDLREKMMGAARGVAVTIDPSAPPLSIFVLLNEEDVSVNKGHLGASGLLFMTDASKAKLKNTMVRSDDRAIEGHVLSLAGRIVAANVKVDRGDIVEPTIGQKFVLRQLSHGDPMSWGGSVLRFFQAAESDTLEDVAGAVNKHRWSSSVWIERDRSMLTLTDELTDQEVFSLIDDDFAQAIEDGYLVAPRHPRPSDSDWHQPALDYAVSTGLMAELELSPRLPQPYVAASAPPSPTYYERPRG